MKKNIKIGLCEGRHPMPVEAYIFGSDINPVDVNALEQEALNQLQRYPAGATFNLYATGLTTALVAALNAAKANDQKVVVWHYNKETGAYFPQQVL